MVILDVPAGVEFEALSLLLRDTVAGSQSPYTGDLSRTDFGGRWWEISLTTLQMGAAVAADFDAWLDDLREVGTVARMPRPVLMPRLGTFSGEAVTLAADRDAGAVLLSVSGLGAGLTLGRGSLVSIGDRMHRVRKTLIGGSGDQLSITPPLRFDALSGDAVEVGSAVAGLWRLMGRPPREHGSAFGRDAAPVSLKFSEATA
jgi:hypothetical protein